MARRTPYSNYFADDKDIYDLLVAAKQKLPVQKLVDLARRRGIILPSGEDRDSLIEQVALLPFGWQQLNELISATDTVERKEKMSSRRLSGDVRIDDVQEAVAVLNDERQVRGETYKVEKNNNSLRVTVGYSELDTSRTRLVQRTEREFTVEVEFSASGETVVRHQDQARAHEIIAELTKKLNSKPEASVVEDRIELAGVREPARRTEFFLRLIRGIAGFTFEDVKSVRASRFHAPETGSILPVSENDEEGGDVFASPDSREPDEIPADEATFVSRVKEVALKGDGLLQSQHYEQLEGDGFFVRSIVWTASEENRTGARVEFEAGFDDAEECTGFTYQIRGTYPRKAGGDFRKTKAAPRPHDRTRLLRLIEDAARESLKQVLAVPQQDDEAGTAA